MRATTKVREQLAELRRSGLPFRTAWTTALGGLSEEERREWLDTLEVTAAAWRDAYGGTPATRAQLALLAIDQDPERDVATNQPDPWERVCGACDGPIPANKQANAVYCSHACQRHANGRRIAA